MEDLSSYQEYGSNSRPHSTMSSVVLLVHYGMVDTTQRCLKSIAIHEGGSQPVVIADHGPGLPLAKYLQDCPSMEKLIILRRENLGFGAGCNAGAEAAFQAGARWVWFLNNDATLASPVLSQLMKLAALFPQVGLWGTRQRDGDRCLGADPLPDWFPTPLFATPLIEGLPAGCLQLDARQTLSGASMLVSKEAWERLGPWPEWCFLYWEDVAWGLRAHELGIPIFMTDLEIIHPRNTTTGHHSPLTTYYGVRNGLLLHELLWPERKCQRVRQALHLLQKRLFQGNWRMLRPTIQGILDARRGLRFRKV